MTETLQGSIGRPHSGIEESNGHGQKFPLSGDIPFVPTNGASEMQLGEDDLTSVLQGFENGHSSNGHEADAENLDDHYAPYAARIAEIHQARILHGEPKPVGSAGQSFRQISLRSSVIPVISETSTMPNRKRLGMRRSIRDRLR